MTLTLAQARWSVAAVAILCALLSLTFAFHLGHAPDESSHMSTHVARFDRTSPDSKSIA